MSRRLQQFFPGETVRVRVAFTDENDLPITVTGVAFAVRAPNGTVTPSGAVAVNTSTFYTDIIVNDAGDYAVRATASAPSSSAVEVQFSVAHSLVLT